MKLKPIVPFEPVSTDKIPGGDNWIAQIKWYGVRVLTYYDGHEVKLYNRKLNERTFHYPELTEIKSYCKANSVILDGEVLALNNEGRVSFHAVMRRDGLRRLERVKQVQKEVPVIYMIFDVIYFNGQWINEWDLEKRMEILSDIIIPKENIQLVNSYRDKENLFNVIVQKEMEGVVIKDLRSKYLIGGKNSQWQKKKNYQDIVAAVGGATLRDGIVNALLLGMEDNKGNLWYIGHAGTGKLSKQDWQQLTQIIKPLIQEHMPFINKPERVKETIWLKPRIKVKVQYIEWTEGYTLRQPSIQAFVNESPDRYPFAERT